jgi:hypothetical protein
MHACHAKITKPPQPRLATLLLLNALHKCPALGKAAGYIHAEQNKDIITEYGLYSVIKKKGESTT